MVISHSLLISREVLILTMVVSHSPYTEIPPFLPFPLLLLSNLQFSVCHICNRLHDYRVIYLLQINVQCYIFWASKPLFSNCSWAAFSSFHRVFAHVQSFTVWPPLHVQCLNGCFAEKWGEHVGNPQSTTVPQNLKSTRVPKMWAIRMRTFTIAQSWNASFLSKPWVIILIPQLSSFSLTLQKPSASSDLYRKFYSRKKMKLVANKNCVIG